MTEMPSNDNLFRTEMDTNIVAFKKKVANFIVILDANLTTDVTTNATDIISANEATLRGTTGPLIEDSATGLENIRKGLQVLTRIAYR